MHCSVMFWRGKSRTMQPRPFTKSSLFGSQLWIYGTINHFEECSAEHLAGNELKWREVLCLATVVTIVEAPFFGIVCIRRMLLSIGIPKRFQILAKRSASTKNEVVQWRLPLAVLLDANQFLEIFHSSLP